MNSKAIKIFDLAKEIVDILSTMTQKELEYLNYNLMFVLNMLNKLKKEKK